ncbi:MAG: DUF1150 family protein [Pseudomonadota bacterium]
MTETNTPIGADGNTLVYVRPISEAELEHILPANAIAELDALDDLFAVHNSDGQRLAIVEGRDAAFAAARAHKLVPTSLH